MMKLSMSPDKENKKTKESKIGEKRVVMAGNMYRQIGQRTSNSSPSNTSVWGKQLSDLPSPSTPKTAMGMAERVDTL